MAHTTELTLRYAQSGAFWPVVNEFSMVGRSLASIQRSLNERFGSAEEVFAIFDVQVPLGQGPFSLGGKIETVIHGVIQNPVVPEIIAQQVAGGILQVGHRALGGGLRSCFFVGFGQERRLAAISTDLLQSVPVRDGSLWLIGAQLSGQMKVLLGERLTLDFNPSFRETIFLTSIKAQSLLENPRQTRFAHRWKAVGSLGWKPLSEHFSAKLNLIFGQQPFLDHLLPYLWDYVTELPSFPDFRSAVGIGGELSWALAQMTGSLSGGFYGGYFGMTLGLNLHRWTAVFSTYGLEASSLYQALGIRTYLFSAKIEI